MRVRFPLEAQSPVYTGFLVAKSNIGEKGKMKRGCAERTGLEPATSAVTGQRSNQLNYRSRNLAYLPGFKNKKSIAKRRFLVKDEPGPTPCQTRLLAV